MSLNPKPRSRAKTYNPMTGEPFDRRFKYSGMFDDRNDALDYASDLRRRKNITHVKTTKSKDDGKWLVWIRTTK